MAESPGVTDVLVNVVWDPPWDPSRCPRTPGSNWACYEPRKVPASVKGGRYDGAGQRPHESGSTHMTGACWGSPTCDFDEIGEQPMITITTAAAVKIKQLAPKEDTECGLRMQGRGRWLLGIAVSDGD